MDLQQLTGILGLAIAIYISVSVYLCWSKNDFFSFRKRAISYAGTTHTASLFKFLVVSNSLFQVFFVSLIYVAYPELQNWFHTLVLVLGISSLILVGLIPSSTSRFWHRFYTATFIVFIILWSFLFHASLYQTHPQTGTACFILSAIVLIGVPLLFYRYKVFGLSELLFAVTVICWNVLISTSMFLDQAAFISF